MIDYKTPFLFKQFLEHACWQIKKEIGQEIFLDRTPESLAFVDPFLQKIQNKKILFGDKQKQILYGVAAYFGEVVQKNLGEISWVLKEKGSSDLPEDWLIKFKHLPLSFDPISMVMAVVSLLRKEDSYENLLIVDKEWQESIESLLSRMSPVSLDYYYSLTGQYETMEYVISLLVELMHQKQEKQKESHPVK